jgi:hypothetical protein
MMLDDLSALFAAVPPHSPAEAYRHAVLEDNVLLKRTFKNRQTSLRHLRVLYGLAPDDLAFGALRAFWALDPQGRPLLALLAAAMRDEVLRSSASVILASAVGASVTPGMLTEAIRSRYPDRYSVKTLQSVGRNLAATWEQAGHLQGHLTKTRVKAHSSPGAAAYALLLGTLMGERGILLFETTWARLLDAPPGELDSHAFMASQRGWLEYRRMGDVVEVSFREFLRALGDQRV